MNRFEPNSSNSPSKFLTNPSIIQLASQPASQPAIHPSIYLFIIPTNSLFLFQQSAQFEVVRFRIRVLYAPLHDYTSHIVHSCYYVILIRNFGISNRQQTTDQPIEKADRPTYSANQPTNIV